MGAENLRRGKQPGAPGAHLAWSESPDDREPLFPQGACGCRRDLADADDLDIARSHQLIDTPAATAKVTQYGRAGLRRRLRARPPVRQGVLLARATQVDAGFDTRVLASMLATLDRFTDSEIPLPDGSSAAELREFYAAWRSELTA